MSALFLAIGSILIVSLFFIGTLSKKDATDPTQKRFTSHMSMLVHFLFNIMMITIVWVTLTSTDAFLSLIGFGLTVAVTIMGWYCMSTMYPCEPKDRLNIWAVGNIPYGIIFILSAVAHYDLPQNAGLDLFVAVLANTFAGAMTLIALGLSYWITVYAHR
ncbi:MAG: hypothetical protein ACRC5C_06730 [Bacilli bacterium]